MAEETPACSTKVQCLILIILVGTLLFIGAALMVLFIPHSPNFQIVCLNTSPLVITPFLLNPDSTILSTTWNLTFVARNPNQRLQLHYTDVEVSIYYKYLRLSHTKLEFFKQTEDTKVVSRVSIANSAVVSNRDAAIIMDEDGSRDHALDFIVKFRGTIKVYVGTSMPTNRALSIDCDDVRAVLSSQNSTFNMIGPPRKCYNRFMF